jgi:hypothetical protein
MNSGELPMKNGETTGRSRKQRPGTCHRCGWRGNVMKVDRHYRKRLLTGRIYGRVCNGCIIELLTKDQLPAEKFTRPVEPGPAQNRDVA